MNNISPLAFVHPEAKLGDNNQIGPFCYIDKNVEIGDNNTFLNGVTVHYVLVSETTTSSFLEQASPQSLRTLSSVVETHFVV